MTKRLRQQGLAAHALGVIATVFLSIPAAAKDLPIVKPAISCSALAETDVSLPAEFPARVITARVVTPETGAPYCEVRGYVASHVQFELRLPTQNWMQRLLYSGCGGFCGRVDFRLRASEGCDAVTNGEFALVSSDLGHQAPDGNADTVWAANNPQGRVDYGYRGVHVVTLAAKAIVARFYGRPQTYAYFNGCSDGGREGLMEVQRYPTDFNGVIAGAAVINDTANNTIFHGWSAQHLQHPNGTSMFSAADLSLLHNAALDACDAAGDGIKDGLIADPIKCHFDPVVTQCRGGQTRDCLTSEQVDAAKALYSGPRDASGSPLYYGRAIGSELLWGGPEVASYARAFITHMTSLEPQPFDLAQVSSDPAALALYNTNTGIFNATNPDIRAFQQSGGKLITWHGWADPGVPPMSSVEYYRAVRRTLGPTTDSFMKLYMLPGVGHCGGGGPDRLNLIDPIMAWVEDGIAPGKINVSLKIYGRTSISRPLYPFPATAHYKGKGEPMDASSFDSSMPK